MKDVSSLKNLIHYPVMLDQVVELCSPEKGGDFIEGRFENTLPIFFKKARPNASIINFDADLYSSTLCALEYSKVVMDKQTILIFDEFIINNNWEDDAYKALNKFCANNNLSYEVLAIFYIVKQVAVKLIGF